MALFINENYINNDFNFNTADFLDVLPNEIPSYIEPEYLNESIGDVINGATDAATEIINKKKQEIVDLIDLKKQWKSVADKFVKHKWIYRYIDEDNKDRILKHYNNITDDNVSYTQYKQSFKAICKFVGLPYNGIIIENLIFEKDDKDKEQDIMALKYSKGLAKINIPKGIHLIHVSPADNIKMLQPSFRSKVKGKYMYPTKRCFFTVAKEIKPTKAGLEKTKTTKYTTKQDITTAYIDPTYSDFSSGSIYIATERPIEVEPFNNKLLDIFKHKKAEVEESYEYEGSYEEMINEIFFDSNTIQMLKKWKTSNQVHGVDKFKSSTLSNEEYENIKEWLDTIKENDGTKFGEYKKAFNNLCKFCGITSNGVIITKYNIKKGSRDDNNSFYMEYSRNTKKITLPEGMKLYHMSKIPNIDKLKPAYKGKSEKGYLYDKPRIYFTIRKHMPKICADYGITKKLYKYICKKDIRDVYVDPLLWTPDQGAVYIETNSPIPVEELTPETAKDIEEKDKEKNVNEEYNFYLAYYGSTNNL